MITTNSLFARKITMPFIVFKMKKFRNNQTLTNLTTFIIFMLAK